MSNNDVQSFAFCNTFVITDTRFFDKGLHKWLVRYIFIPLGGTNKNQGFLRSMLNSVLVFGFVYTWHGYQFHHLIWASWNWLGVFLEKVADSIYRMKPVQNYEVSRASYLNFRFAVQCRLRQCTSCRNLVV